MAYYDLKALPLDLPASKEHLLMSFPRAEPHLLPAAKSQT